jgi:hypothetical protein
MRYYAGIGSRETPPEVCAEMTKLGTMLEACGFTLRSGNATGADQAFALGVETEAQIWLPHANFEKEFRLKVKPQHDYRVLSAFDMEAITSVEDYHPNAHNLSKASCLFMARNYRQVIGLDEPNSEFVICWTPGGVPAGGTAQALRIAKKHNIFTVNMFDRGTAQQVIDYLSIWREI